MNPRLRFLVSAALCCGLSFSAAAHADALANIKKAGVLRVAVPQDFPPFGSVGADLKPQGYDIDVAAMLARDLGVKLALTPVTSANRVPFLTTGKVDLVISSLGKNPEREKVLDFSVAYAPFYNGVFGPAGASVANVAALAGKTIAVTRGSVEDLELSKVAPASAVIKRFEDNNSTVSAYYSGQVQLIATGNVVAAALKKRDTQKSLETKFLIKDSPCFIGINKNEPQLLARVNAAVASARKSGELNRISLRWLNTPLPAAF
ncbi:transporter substrate-binding domain-containing protein [Paludibacterium yongneupense]|uniref:transporter substrate-binding domain-containing protein n=1 Tax=Paludibacterium yongneupense TaxID=400061 RepID=UPI0004028B3F|nr:transporter substrate-binding domain-containing protein [Paludibacterium yongneupense]